MFVAIALALFAVIWAMRAVKKEVHEPLWFWIALDLWSIVHSSAGVVMGLWRIPFPVMAVLTVAWEVFEMTVPGFGDHEINANHLTDIFLAWGGWFAGAGARGLAAKQPLPLGQKGSWW